MLELLAPAKNKECAFAAIDFGADAVYIGANSFGARKNATNSISDIKEIVDYAHKFNVKIYVTVNTILKDNELKQAEELVKNLKNINVDALIIQDMALIEIAKKFDMQIHASTQCDNRTVQKVKFLQDIGFSRVVLARELSLSQIKEIRKCTNVELEAFVHGALCVSYSGQCYLSFANGGRSANRGECAQSCRKKYSLIDEKGNSIAKNKYLLCLKDFNLSDNLEALANAGVASLKIEGRLKDVNYVKNVVAFYRKKIDALKFKKSSIGHINFDFEPNPEKSFNRGFTDYFFKKRQKCYTFDSPKSKGQFLGKVKAVGKTWFEIDNKCILSPQDGLFFIQNGDESGCKVNKFEKGKIFPNKMPKLKVGTSVFRNFDFAFEKILKNSKTNRKIFAEISFAQNSISIVDEQNISSNIEFCATESAKNQEKMRENIEKQFKKTGESIFEIKNIKIGTDNLPFLPVSRLNELRRELIEKQVQKRQIEFEKCFDNSFGDVAARSAAFPATSVDYKANVLNSKAETFYSNCGVSVTERALEDGHVAKEKCVMTTKHCLRWAFDMCLKAHPKGAQTLFLIDEKGKKYSLKFDCKNCEMQILNK